MEKATQSHPSKPVIYPTIDGVLQCGQQQTY